MLMPPCVMYVTWYQRNTNTPCTSSCVCVFVCGVYLRAYERFVYCLCSLFASDTPPSTPYALNLYFKKPPRIRDSAHVQHCRYTRARTRTHTHGHVHKHSIAFVSLLSYKISTEAPVCMDAHAFVYIYTQYTHKRARAHTRMYLYTYVCTYACVCVCVCI